MTTLSSRATFDIQGRFGSLMPIELAGIAASASVGISLPFLISSDLSWLLIALLLIATGISLVLSMLVLSRHFSMGVLNPGTVLPSYLFLLYVLRPLTIIISGLAGSPVTGQQPLATARDAFNSTLGITSIATIAFAATYTFAPSFTIFNSLRRPRALHRYFGTRFVIVFAISFLACVYIFSHLLSYESGWQAALTVRQIFFQGHNYIVWMMILYKFAFLVWLALTLVSTEMNSRGPFVILFLLLWLPTLIFDSIAGSRAEIILGNIIPTFAVIACSQKNAHIGNCAVLALIMASVIVFVGYRAVVRDKFSDGNAGASPLNAIARSTISLPSFLMTKDEASAFDYLMLTREEVPSRLGFRGLEDVSSVLLALTPSSVVKGKPPRSGVILTRELLPGAYANGGNIAFSGAADLYFMAGDVSVVLGFALIGLIAGTTLKSLGALSKAGPNRGLILALGFVMASEFLSIFRSDLFQTLFVPTVLFLFVSMILFLTEAHQDPDMQSDGREQEGEG